MPTKADITKEQIVEFYVHGGMTTLETATALGVSEPTLLRHMKLHGIKGRPRGSKVPERAEAYAERDRRILKMSEEGYSLGDIATKFRISRQRVHSILKGEKTAALKGRNSGT